MKPSLFLHFPQPLSLPLSHLYSLLFETVSRPRPPPRRSSIAHSSSASGRNARFRHNYRLSITATYPAASLPVSKPTATTVYEFTVEQSRAALSRCPFFFPRRGLLGPRNRFFDDRSVPPAPRPTAAPPPTDREPRFTEPRCRPRRLDTRRAWRGLARAIVHCPGCCCSLPKVNTISAFARPAAARTIAPGPRSRDPALRAFYNHRQYSPISFARNRAGSRVQDNAFSPNSTKPGTGRGNFQ